MTLLHMLTFFTFFSTLTLLTHLYLYRRLFRDVHDNPRWRRAGKIGLSAMALLMAAGLVLNRFELNPLGRGFSFLIYGWMGFIGVSVPLLFATDLVRWGVRLTRRGAGGAEGAEGPADPQRRLVISRSAATLTGVGAVLASAQATHTGLREPELREVEVPIRDLPAALDGLRIVQLSDIHIGPTIGHDFLSAVVARVNALKPDLVAITGDLVDGSVQGLSPHTAPLADLKSRHGSFFCTGNHEYYSGVEPWVAELSRLGVRSLRNERVRLDHDGAALDLLGVEDWSTRGRPGGHDPDAACAGRDPAVPAVLLAHQPRSIFDADRLGIDLVLSGHTHGGQLWPMRWIVKLVQPYVEDLHQHSERTWIYVHPGTGYWGPPMRLATRAQIALLTLRRASA